MLKIARKVQTNNTYLEVQLQNNNMHNHPAGSQKYLNDNASTHAQHQHFFYLHQSHCILIDPKFGGPYKTPQKTE